VSTDPPAPSAEPAARSSRLQALITAMHDSGERAPATGVLTEPLSGLACSNGMAGPFPCRGIGLESYLPLNEVGGGNGNDIWGWTDPQTGRDYALMGKTTGTAFIDIGNPREPLYLGDLPSHQRDRQFAVWRDIRPTATTRSSSPTRPVTGCRSST
jgi:hypothetical protein